jgi:HK97 family phage prohead protease
MPWSIEADHPSCPAAEPFAVVKDEDAEVVGCHVSEQAAQRQVAALYAAEGGSGNAGRSQRPDPVPYARSWALDDIEILRTADGFSDGRTVSAYAAVFDRATEITDQHGHYMEVIARTAFNRQIGLGLERVGVYYHHGLTIHGTPSELGSVPIGSPVTIVPDRKGLRTVTRFNASPLAESVLEAIRHGDIRGYSFRGRIFESKPARVPRVARGGALPTITRTVLGLTEYGPTPSPAYAEAGILAIRALQALASTTPGFLGPDQETPPVTPDLGSDGAEDQPDRHSDRLRQRHLALKRAIRERGLPKENGHGA